MKTKHLVSLLAAALAAVSASSLIAADKEASTAQTTIATNSVTITSDFPGGNIVVEKIEGSDVYLHQDLRDTIGDWFYWSFAVHGAAGRNMTFHFTKSKAVGNLGPGISRDQGKTWEWLGKQDSTTAFSYAFGQQEQEVRFSVGMPYQEADLLRFLSKHQTSKHLRTEVLGKTRRGTPVELLHLGKIEGEASFKVLVTVRHHACEMMASYVAEGLMEAMLGDTDTARWLQAHVHCAVVPLVDKDGVERGDQGKNRWPHDHKADYRGKSIYPEIAALRAFTDRWSGGRPDVVLDLHNPTLNGRVIYSHALRGTSGGTPEEIATLLAKSNSLRFLQTLERVQQGPLQMRVQDSLEFAARIAGKRPESEVDEQRQNSIAAEQPADHAVTIGFEIPYSLVGGVPVTPHSARSLGHDLARTLEAYLKAPR